MKHPFLQRALMLGLLTVAASLMLTACGGGGGGTEKSAAVEGPKDTLAIFEKKCVSCHATDLKGRMGPDTDLTQVGAKMTKEEIVTQIAKGSTRMPAFEKLLEADEINKLADWLSTQK